MNEIAKAIKEALSLWRAYLEGRQAAYERKMDKRMRKAVEAGERYIRTNIDPELTDGVRNRRLGKYEKDFFKYNN